MGNKVLCARGDAIVAGGMAMGRPGEETSHLLPLVLLLCQHFCACFCQQMCKHLPRVRHSVRHWGPRPTVGERTVWGRVHTRSQFLYP